MKDRLADYVSTEEAADIMGVSRIWVWRLVTETKRLRGKRIGRMWVVRLRDIKAYLRAKKKRKGA